MVKTANDASQSRPSHVHVLVQLSDGSRTTISQPFTGEGYIIGRKQPTKRGQGSMIQINDKFISRSHSRLFWQEQQGWTIADMGSANGTKFQGEPLTTPMPWPYHAVVQLGTSVLTLVTEPVQEESVDSADETVVRGAIAESHDQEHFDDEATVLYPSQNRPKLSGIDPTMDAGKRPVGSSDASLSQSGMSGDSSALLNKGGEQSQSQASIGLSQDKKTQATINVKKAQSQKTVDKRGQPKQTEGGSRQKLPNKLELLFQQGLAADLIKANLLDEQQTLALITKTRQNGKTFFRTLGETRSIRFLEQIYKNVAERLGIEYIDDEKDLFAQVHEPSWLSYDTAFHMGIAALPVSQEGPNKVITRYATIDPFDVMTHDWVETQCGTAANMVLVFPDAYFPTLRRLKSRNVEDDQDSIGVAVNITAEEETAIREHIDGVDVPQMVNYFIHRAHAQTASDVHIEPTEGHMIVRNRVDGILHEEISLPMDFHAEVISRIKIMSGMDVAEKRHPQDGRFGVSVRGNPLDVRVSTYPTVYGEKVVFRLLDRNALHPSPVDLGLMDRDLRLLRDKISSPFGMVMISGPTGSGKTTTLYSCLGSIDKKSKNVLTVEDPVEYRLNGVHQMQVNDKIGLTFAKGLRTILRQDPDVVMVGECRDTETAAMAVQAALTGHIVFSTIHTNDAIGVVTRLLDMGIEPFLVANSLTLAIAQRLVRTVCKHCKVAITGGKILATLEEEGVSLERLNHLGIEVDPDMDYLEGVGCVHCRQSGFMGRRAVFEVFEMTNQARNIIMADFKADRLRDMARKSGMTTLISHGLTLVEEEITTFGEVIRVLGEGY